MKRIISLVMLIMALAVPGLKAADHISFMGIPVNGRISTFCNKLVSQKGLKIVNSDDSRGVYTLSGRFAGYNNCEFYVFDNDDTKQVYRVDVYLPECTTWNSIKNQYNKIVRDYRSNSAYRFDEAETVFESPYREGDGDEVAAVKADKINYHTDFFTDGGLLVIRITHFMQVRLTFYDSENYPSDNDGGSTGGSSGGVGGVGGNSGGTGGVGAGTSAGALQFMGIPMVGNINSFAQQLVNQKGCRIVSNNTESNSISMRGTFTGKDCEIYVFGTDNTKRVWKVTVYLPELRTWQAIKREYLNYKSQFDNKYTLTSSYDFFADPYDEGDGREVEAIKEDKCHYSAFYDAPGGNIMVKVSKYMQVQISYEDNAGFNVRERENGNSSSGGGGNFNDI